MKTSKILTHSALAAILLLPIFVFAEDPPIPNPPRDPAPGPVTFPIKIPNPLAGKVDNIPALLNKIISEAILPIGGVVVVIMIIYAGFLYVTARGSPDQLKKAHDALLYAVIGAAILLGARVLAEVIDTTVKQIGGGI